MLIWSAWNFVTPIFALFAATQVPGSSIEVAASSYSAHLIGRVISELFSGKYLARSTDKTKAIASALGIAIITVSFIGFAYTQQIILLYVFYAISGIGIGIASPAKNSLFAMHLDKNKEAAEWGVYDAATFTCTAMASTLGGFIAKLYGFHVLFLLAALINILGTLPYLLFFSDKKR